MEEKTKRVLGVFTLAMINVAAIASLRAIPSMAEYGFAAVFFLALVALIFFIPTALVSAELATGWPRRGGVYAWVKEAFGQRFGFLAIWLQWIQNVIWYPTVLSFTAATLAFVITPALATNPLYMVGVIFVVYWGATLLNFRGMKTSGWFSSFCVMAGTIIPGAIIILLGILWLLGGNPSQIPLTVDALVPDMSSLSNIVLVAGMLLAMAGMEMSAVHAREVKDPQKDYPKAIFTAVAIVLAVFILGSLSVAIVVPQAKISLVAGIMQAFTDFFTAYGIPWAVPLLAILIAVGAVGQVSTWIAGPSKGLFTVAKDGSLPPFFQKANKNGVQVNILLVQGCIVTLLALVFLLMPSVSSSYWILTALTAQLYLIMYAMLFLAAIKLRYSQPGVKRPYTVPGGNLGMWIIAGIGLLAALAGILLGFIPPSQLETGNAEFYYAFLGTGILVMVGAPLVLHHIRKPSWAKGASAPPPAAAKAGKPAGIQAGQAARPAAKPEAKPAKAAVKSKPRAKARARAKAKAPKAKQAAKPAAKAGKAKKG